MYVPETFGPPSLNIAPYFYAWLQKLGGVFPLLIPFFKNIVGVLIGLAIVLSVFFLVVIIYCVERIKEIKKKEAEKYDIPVVPITEPTQAGDAGMAMRWESIKLHIDSDNPNDWRQAIIDADIILDDLLSRLGYRGESVGEKLKRAHTGDFLSLQNAWEAHKVRNEIAHQGTNYQINKLEAKTTIDNYRKVFEEFYFL